MKTIIDLTRTDTNPNGAAPGSPPPPSQPALTPPGYFARVAGVAGICSFVALESAAILIRRGATLPLSIFDLTLASLCISAVMGGVFGIWWTVRMVQRPIRLEDQRLRLENERLKAELEAARAELVTVEEEPNRGLHIALAAQRILVLHYILGKKTTRAECQKLGIAQTHWNAAESIFRALGLRTGEGRSAAWSVQDPAAAFEAWNTVKILPHGESYWIRSSGGARRHYLETS